MKQIRNGKRLLAVALSVLLAFGGLPTAALAEGQPVQVTQGLCEHHLEHTAECGYAERQPCEHEHSEDCYTDELICGYDEEAETTASDSEAEHTHTQECYAQDCPHERGKHDDTCGYEKAQACGYTCELCGKTDNEPEPKPGDETEQTACSLTEGCTLVDGHDGGCGYAPDSEGTPCKHTHDADCGYIEAVEGQPCGHVHDETCGNPPIPDAGITLNAANDSVLSQGNGYTYDPGSRTLTITSANGLTAWPEDSEIKRLGGKDAIGSLSISGVTEIGVSAFSYCSNMTSVTLGEGLVTVGEEAFKGCALLENLVLPGSLESIERSAFERCAKMNTSLPDGLESIGNSAFKSCTALALTALPRGLTTLGGGAFNGCTSLAISALPDNIAIIGQGCFMDCSSLVRMELPAGLTKIDLSAFTNCSKLSTLTFLGTTAPSLVIVGSQFPTPFQGVAESGVLRYPAGADYSTVKAALPDGWTEQELGSGAIESVAVSPSEVTIQRGASLRFSASVQGKDSPSQRVNWSVSPADGGSTFNQDGLLTVADGETAKSLTVTAASVVNPDKSGSATVTVTGDSIVFTISGVITDNNTGAGLAGIQVTLWLEGKKAGEATTDAEGRYTCQDLPQGDYAVRAGGHASTGVYYTERSGNVTLLDGDKTCDLALSQGQPPQPSLGTFVYGNLRYDIISENPKEVSVRGWAGAPMEHLTIPATVQNGGETYDVVQIGNSAFCNKALEMVSLPQNGKLRKIGAQAFFNSELMMLESNRTLTIPASVTHIGDQAFFGDTFRYLEFPENSRLAVIGDEAFMYTGLDDTLTIPASVTHIGSRAFAYITIKRLVLPQEGSLSIIGNEAFRQAERSDDSGYGYLTGTLTIPASVNHIGNQAFNTNDLNKVDLSAFSGTLGDEVFGYGPVKELVFTENPAPAYEAGSFADMEKNGIVYYPSGADGYTPSAFAGGALSGWMFTSQDIGISRPSKPLGLSCYKGNGQVLLTWKAPANDGGAQIVKYQYRIGLGGMTEWRDVPAADDYTPPHRTTAYSVTGLKNGTEYEFMVRAVNSLGAGEANIVIATPEESAATYSISGGLRGNNMEPLPGITVTLWQGGKQIGSVISSLDYEASFSFPSLSAGVYVVKIEDGWSNGQYYIEGSNPSVYIITDKDIRDFWGMDLGNAPGTYSISGGVVKADTSDDLSIGVTLWQGGRQVGGVTATEGDYSFTSLTPGEYTVKAGGSQANDGVYYIEQSKTVTITDKDEDVTFKLQPGNAPATYSISGMVYSGDDSLTIFTGIDVTLWQDGQQVGAVNTDRDGNYSFTSLAPGTYTVKAGGWSGGIYYTEQSKTVTITDKDQSCSFNLQPGTAPGSYAVTGTVKGSDNSGLSGVSVQLMTGDIKQYETTTGGNGGYSFSDVSEGTYTLKIPAGTYGGTVYQEATKAITVSGQNLSVGDVKLSAATVPTAPQNFQATPGDMGVVLTWDAPVSDGGAAITKYEVSKDGGASWEGTTEGTIFAFIALTNGQSYTFQVRAVNSAGPSEAASVTAMPQAYTYTLTVTNGTDVTASGPYAAGANVNIRANVPVDGKLFKQWTSSGGGKFADAFSPETTFTMPYGNVTVTATYEDDQTVPTGTITVKNNGWTEFLNAITFGVFFKETQQVSITAQDNSGQDVAIAYHMANAALTLDQVQALAEGQWTAYADKFSIAPNTKLVIYARLTDKAGNVTYISSNGIVLDDAAPSFSLEDGKTYDSAQTLTVTDNYALASVKLGEAEQLSPDFTGAETQIALNVNGAYTIEATDKAGNTASITVTIDIPVVTAPNLTGITAPTAITGVANGTPLTDISLPDKVAITTTEGVKQAGVTWNRNVPAYNPASETAQTFTISGNVTLPDGVTNTNGVSLTVTIRVTVEAKGAVTVTGLEIASNPNQTAYAEGEALDLTGLSVKLTFSDGSDKTVALVDFAANNITATPANGAKLSLSNTTVTVSAGGKSAGFTITVNAMQQVQTPSFSPAGGAYEAAQEVEIACGTPGAKIHYTTDGSAPTAASPLYTGKIPVGSTTTIKAIGIKDGMKNSAVATATYTINTTPPPVITVPGAPRSFKATPGDKRVILSWTAPQSNGGAEITKYEVSKDNGANWENASSATGHTFTGLNNGQGYTFRVRAVNSKGAGAEASATATPSAAVYRLTVTNGRDITNSGPYQAGARVRIQADAATNGWTFDKWAGGADSIFVSGSRTSSTTTITMPAGDVAVTATYKKINNGGGSSTGGGGSSSGSGNNSANDSAITAPKSNYTVTGDKISQSVSRTDLKKLADDRKSLTLNSGEASMTFDPAALKAILAAVPATAGNITFAAAPADISAFPEAAKLIGNRPVYNYAISYKDSKWNTVTAKVNFPAGSVSISMSYTPAEGEVTGNLFMVYVDGKGAVTWLDKSSYSSGKVLADVPHFSIYGVAYKAPATVFTDITGHWAKADMEFVAARGLLSGTGEKVFSPDTAMTRGMFVTALGRLAGVNPASYQTRSFTDVKADAYYAAYVEWAAQKNIAGGTGEGLFSPDAPVTREQMAVMMTNYAGQMGYSIPTPLAAVTFADNDKISAWAAKEVAAMQRAGIIKGKDGNRFDPQGNATRAEVSAVLRRFVEIVIDPVTAQGWVKNDSGQWLYYKDGKAITGWKQLGGKWYYFDKNGIMAVNIKIDGYEIGPDGARKENH